MAISRLAARASLSWGLFYGFFSVLDAIRARKRQNLVESIRSGIGIVQNVECATNFPYFFVKKRVMWVGFGKNQICDSSPLSQ